MLAEEIKRLATRDGNVLLFNIHISQHNAIQILYPNTDEDLPDKFARLLFTMSSPLPSPIMAVAKKEEGIDMVVGVRGFAFNADLVTLIMFLDIGTRTENAADFSEHDEDR